MKPNSMNPLIVGVASSALFDTHKEHEIFEKDGLRKFINYQIENEDIPLKMGTAFPLIHALLRLQERCKDKGMVEVVILSRNHSAAGLRVMQSVKHHGLRISVAAFAAGTSIADYLAAYEITLFLSANPTDVAEAISKGFAAGLICDPPTECALTDDLRIAFDGDSVIFSDESDRVYNASNLETFLVNEDLKATSPLPPGPLKPFLKAVGDLQRYFEEASKAGDLPIKTALVTARSSATCERVLKTLRSWEIEIDLMFMQNGRNKAGVLKVFRPHIYFDDQYKNLTPVSDFVPCARVPYGIFAQKEDNAARAQTVDRQPLTTSDPAEGAQNPSTSTALPRESPTEIGAQSPAEPANLPAEVSRLSKVDFERRCRSVFVTYVPMNGGHHALPKTYRDFIGEGLRRDGKERARIAAELEKYKLSSLEMYEPMLNREDDDLAAKLSGLLQSTIQQTELNLGAK